MSIAEANMTEDVAAIMDDLGQRARAAAQSLGLASRAEKDKALLAAAEALDARRQDILAANDKDMAAGRAKGLTPALLDRLALDDARINGIIDGLKAIAELKDPVGTITDQWDQPSGLNIARVRVPLGVIGIIYESRPNVTADAGALCLKSGNAVILRGGSESFHSSRAIHACLVQGLTAAGLPEDAIQMIPTTDRAAVGEMLAGLNGNIDVIVPRGGKSLIERVQTEARVPVFAHLEGLCHVYVDGAANMAMASAIALNAKMRRTSICGAAETLLVDAAVSAADRANIVKALLDAGCEVRGDATIQGDDDRVVAATAEDWTTEYLEPVISVCVVEGVDGAVRHINTHGSNHTDTIITDDQAVADRFLTHVDSAIVMHNASTQYADGGEFGMGAEIGISTGRMHARGPVGLEQLTSFKYVVRGTGQTRP